jgi:sulfatase modifying factor 1
MKNILSFFLFLFGCQSSINETDTQANLAQDTTCHTTLPDAKTFPANNTSTSILDFSDNIRIIGAEQPKGQYVGLVRHKDLKIPPNMIFIKGGFTKIGSENGLPHEHPTFWVEVKPFLMDISPVTVAEFDTFVKTTNYVTEAEKFGNSGVIDESTGGQWVLKEGANWRYPQGTDLPPAPANHPVTQVSWHDAEAYCIWAGKRLPNEIEWEHAAKNAQNDASIYPFGNQIDENGIFKANVWQGTFPIKNLVKDGFKFTSPVGYFGKTPLGLTDMAGNVWEWCQDWKYDYKMIIENLGIKQGVVQKQEKVIRGGSFLCEPSYCHGYRVSARSFTSPETGLMHVGFRCVKDLE